MNLGFWASGRAEDLIFSVFKQAKQSDHAASGAFSGRFCLSDYMIFVAP
ncbi:MAG: hypothetical protein ACLUP7_03040 [Eubacterium sp.]|jgi:hypothetical protein|nr:hypothetical protein [Clostridiales bacterium]MEE0174851.1 hypothetical protein [Eubacterium sp.]